ncbi:lysosomal acid lipase/cholesteryl ester hydrolase-like [Centruroides sculpturatus]|uniref:lysosomal acid lipase/cholesteryl ester hydrolase-like n=1 Tax=Centruroides sculpturatus TaxID=218467 RepID=UPI000C6EE508|nr:lysosomal acid lipase/cholesteryl ester hydrolase-like [Centruroides sculpturatus]
MHRSYVCLLFLCLGLANCLDLLNILTILNEDEPDANRNITEIIRSKGYPVEEYSVRTKDGYVLSVQRIPYGLSGKQNTANRPVAYLQHGLLESATDWVLNFPNQSLGYILADSGYDVWLGNQRGNTYSKKHVEYSTKEERFWNFTIDEFAKYDVPDTIEFILNKTNQSQVYYIGQSQGNTVVYALLSDRPDYDKIKAVLSLGPVATVGHITSPLRLLAPLTSPIDLLSKKLGYREFLSNSFVMKLFAQVGCGFEKFNILCSNVYFLMNGYNPSQLNRSRIDVYMSHYPAGSSTKNIVHFGQMMNSKKLQKFDYGPEKNVIAYNQPTPPEYKIENIRTPIALFWSKNDNLADPKDVSILREKIQNLAADYRVDSEEWGHLDFIMATDAKKYVYDELIRVMKSI